MNVPQLRFSGFEGEWEKKQIKDIAPLQRGFDLVKDNIVPGKYPIGYSNGILGYHNEYKAKGPGVFTGRSGTIGNIHYTDSDYWPHNTSLWVTDFKGNNEKFIYYFYKRVDLKKYNAGSTVPTLNRNDVHDLKRAIPKRAEQEKIATFLTLLETRIEKQQEKIEKLEHFKKGMMQKVFSQELRFKDEDDGEFPEWENKKLGEVGLFKSGVGFSEKFQGKQGLKYPFIKVSDMNLEQNAKSIVVSNHTVSNEMLREMKVKAIEDPAILFAKVGAAIFLERKRIIRTPFLIDNNMMSFIPLKNMDLEFAYHLLNYLRLSAFAQVGALPSYNGSDLGTIKIQLPVLEEQLKISEYINGVDLKIEKEKEKLMVLEEQKKGFMQGMFV